MTNNVNDRLSKAYQLLMQNNFTLICDISNELKCSICKGVLINACQTVCGCIFCEGCINNYKRGGGTCCPGDTDECKTDPLSNIVPDHRKNRVISRLSVRCNEDSCGKECQLIDLETHLENCRGKKLNCPFNNIGCEKDKLCYERMNEHLQMESYSHNKSLIELINEMRNEIRGLRENEEKSRCENLIIKEDGIKTENAFNTLNEYMNEMKEEINKLKVSLNEKVEEITALTETVKVKVEMIDLINVQFDKFKKEKEKMNKEKRQMMLSIDKLNQYLNVRDAMFTWDIGILDELNCMQHSVPFYKRYSLYKMGLELIDCGKLKNNSNGSKELTKIYDILKPSLRDPDDALIIQFYIYRGESDAHLKWPFRANITVTMSDLVTRGESVGVTNECIIDRPNTRYKSGKNCKFVFYKSEMRKDDEIIKFMIPFRVECFTDIID